MYCPNCGNYAESNFCPDCGCDLQKVAFRNKPSKSASHKAVRNIYWGDTQISQQQFDEIQQQIKAGEKLEAIKRIRMWTSLSLTDALHIADNFYSIDFSQPQTLIHINRNTHHLSDDSRNVNQIKAQKTVKAAGKAVGLAALFGGYGVFHVISGLVKPYMGKRK